jgi:hypothetical protein
MFIPLNEGKALHDQNKPFNFCLVGFQKIAEGEKVVKPLAPYSRDSQKIVHELFIDYFTRKVKQGLHYFKLLSRTIAQYMKGGVV